MKLSTDISLTGPSDLDVLLFTKHLATMIKSGIPIADALDTLAIQTESGAFKSIIESIHTAVENGQSLTKALKKHPKVFDEFYVSLITISEETGTLDENLDFIAKQLGKNIALKKKVQAATLYPTLVFVAALVMGGFIALYVLPQLVTLFEAFQVELPLTTRILLVIANAFKYHGFGIVAGLIASVLCFNLLVVTPMVKPLWHRVLLQLPLVGAFISSTNLAQFSRNLGILVKSGVPISDSIEVTANTLKNEVFKSDLLAVGTALKGGKSIREAMEKGGYQEFPPLVSRMIGVGEKTGNLDDALLYLGDFYEEEIDTFSKNLTTVLEPILLLAIGLAVGFVALAIITPIYELSGSIRR